MKPRLTQGTLAAAIVVAALSVAGPALAQPRGDEFGSHVADCTQDVGFDGAHNPGVHRGGAGWDGGAECQG